MNETPWYKRHLKKVIGTVLGLVGAVIYGTITKEEAIAELWKQLVALVGG